MTKYAFFGRYEEILGGIIAQVSLLHSSLGLNCNLKWVYHGIHKVSVIEVFKNRIGRIIVINASLSPSSLFF